MKNDQINEIKATLREIDVVAKVKLEDNRFEVKCKTQEGFRKASRCFIPFNTPKFNVCVSYGFY